MSKILDVNVTCPQCGESYDSKLFRTVWGENENLRAKVMNNDINILECPHCHHKFHAPIAMLYVDAVKKFAVWWEPVYDSQIDEMTAGFSQMLGPGNYYETAPRVTDWEEFKETVNRYYRGELKGQSDSASKHQEEMATRVIGNLLKELEQKQKKQKSGCFSSVVVFLLLATTALYSIFSIM